MELTDSQKETIEMLVAAQIIEDMRDRVVGKTYRGRFESISYELVIDDLKVPGMHLNTKWEVW